MCIANTKAQTPTMHEDTQNIPTSAFERRIDLTKTFKTLEINNNDTKIEVFVDGTKLDLSDVCKIDICLEPMTCKISTTRSELFKLK